MPHNNRQARYRTELAQLPRSHAAGSLHRWQGLLGSRDALALIEAAQQHDGVLLVITSNEQQTWQLETALRFYADADTRLWHFPNWETLPYDLFSPHPELISSRLATLHQLPSLQRGIVLATVDALLQRLPPVDYVQQRSFILKRGDTLPLTELRAQLIKAGYAHTSEVRTQGEFAVRGGLLDIYPMGSFEAFRIELLDDEVETLRQIDPATQLSIESIEQIRVLPAREFPLDEAAISAFRARYRARFSGDLARARVYQDISHGQVPAGIESYLPLFHEHTASLLDYLPESALLIQHGDVTAALAQSSEEIHQRHRDRSVDLERPLLAPDEAFWSQDEVASRMQRWPCVQISLAAADSDTTTLPQFTRANEADTLAAVAAWLQQQIKAGQRCLLVAESPGRRELLREQLRHCDASLPLHDSPSWAAFVEADTPLGLTVAELANGLALTQPRISVITESQIHPQRTPVRRRKTQPSRDPEAILRDLTDLAPGAPVVHVDHGVGRYLGLQSLTAGGQTQEFLALEYADQAKLYVPVGALHLVHRYTGSEAEHAPWHRLGSEQWQRAKQRAAEKARDSAAELLAIHARRAASRGQSMPVQPTDYARFCAAFPFAETPDQLQAIEAALADLASTQPADRVVCGDVGFGKTEVALRAAFAATSNNAQVCVLAPTTLLAQQHYRNFADRFADWPVRVGSLSRLGGSKAQAQTLEDLATGKLDIVVGTHRLLQKDIRFKRLGLVIVDEEHRFGVRHKEHIKQLRAHVDLLTLTATPIPRTLNMSLAGLRDLSIIATAPSDRLSVKTFTSEWQGSLIQEAVQRELRRGGQVYFLHNEVKSIERIARELRELLPQVRLGIAHGQQRERDLEAVMLDFYHQRINVLLCTTIIESGIDVPSANTIIVNRADKLGLAQLHQLRGRVGRSHHQAYAYMLVPDRRALSHDANKRLEAIESLDELGAGFTLATHDMEIRGAGELLGEGQSGQMEEIGFTLYNQLLARATRAYKLGELDAHTALEPVHGCEIDLSLPTLLPHDYVPDVHLRLVLYKRISEAPDQTALRQLQVEMIDRFGLLPTATSNLFAVTGLRHAADTLGLTKLELGPDGGRVLFAENTRVEPARLIALLQSRPTSFKLKGQSQLHINLALSNASERLNFAEVLLGDLSGKSATLQLSEPLTTN